MNTPSTMYINKDTNEVLFSYKTPESIVWLEVPDDVELVFQNDCDDEDRYAFAKIVDTMVLTKGEKDNFWTESKWNGFDDIKSYKGNTIIWEKDFQSNVEKTDEIKTPMRLVLDANGEYKVRSNTGEASDTFIMDLLDGVEVLTKHKCDNDWYQWKPSQNMTDVDGIWVECGNSLVTFDEYVDNRKEYLTIIDLRCEAPSNDDVNNTTHDVVHDVVHHPKHYTEDPSGVECIQLTSLLPCCLSNSLKYLWRCGKKDEDLQELKKALFYINYSIEHNLPSFIQGVSDTLEFENLINRVKKHWNGDKYMFIDALYWGDQPTMKRAIENMICNTFNTTSNIEK